MSKVLSSSGYLYNARTATGEQLSKDLCTIGNNIEMPAKASTLVVSGWIRKCERADKADTMIGIDEPLHEFELHHCHNAGVREEVEKAEPFQAYSTRLPS